MRRINLNLLGIKINFKCPFLNGLKKRVKGKNNTIFVGKYVLADVKIDGENNSVYITDLGYASKEIASLKINIKGNNNHIKIEKIRAGNIFIDIGNYTGANDVNIEILDNFTSSNVKILAYNNGVPIRIGKGCMFSDSVLRTGELPHAVFDVNTFENFDKSDGIFIGNHVWVGEHSYIMKNAKIADNSIVGAMSLVTKEFTENNVLIAGNPAKIKKHNIQWADDYRSVPKNN